jgi:putative PIN family toxin of toxin-antitoxin system
MMWKAWLTTYALRPITRRASLVIVVLDSGVWISALHFGGTPLVALEKALSVDEVAICDQIVSEISRVLVEKLTWDRERVRESFSLYGHVLQYATVSGELHGICRDSKDDMVFECAINAGATLIVTGDRDLLAVQTYEMIRVVTPRTYVEGVPL